jgi:hypothetical protein
MNEKHSVERFIISKTMIYIFRNLFVVINQDQDHLQKILPIPIEVSMMVRDTEIEGGGIEIHIIKVEVLVLLQTGSHRTIQQMEKVMVEKGLHLLKMIERKKRKEVELVSVVDQDHLFQRDLVVPFRRTLRDLALSTVEIRLL